MSVVCKRLYGGGISRATVEDYVSGVFPSSKYDTLCACMFQLLYELDAKLEERTRGAERQMTF